MPRIPAASQVSSIVTPSAANGQPKAITSAPGSGAPITANVAAAVPAGAMLANVLRPDTRQPPSTGVATAVGLVQSFPPVDTRTMRSSPTRLSVGSTTVSPRRQRHAAARTMWRCIEHASAVDPQARAMTR